MQRRKHPGEKAQSIPDWALRYEAGEFPPWSLTVDVLALAVDVATEDLHAMLIVRGQPGPFHRYHAWPGGFVRWENDRDGSAAALRELEEETGQTEPDYLEELRTYDALGRDPRQFAGHPDPATGKWISRGTRVVSRAFLALLRKEGRVLKCDPVSDAAACEWVSVYAYLPWEDVRTGAGVTTLRRIRQALEQWADAAPAAAREERHRRIDRYFGLAQWNEEEARSRWDLLFEARLVEEAWRDRWGRREPDAPRTLYGEALAFDHRTMLADALGALRSKIKREPEAARALIGSEFKLSEFQSVYEAVGGRRLYRSNFRRAVSLSSSTIVAPSGQKESPSGRGKPAELYDFEPDALRTRLTPGLNLPWMPIEA